MKKLISFICIIFLNAFGSNIFEIIENKNIEENTRIEKIYRLIKEDLNVVNSTDKMQQTPMHKAALSGNPAVVRLLLDYGASVNVGDRFGYSPLYYGVSSGNFDVVKLLLDNSAKVNSASLKGQVPFHSAALSGNLDVIKLLLDKGVNVNVEDLNKHTPLHYAPLSGNSDAIQLLLDNGANINARDNYGSTPLYNAVAYGNPNMVKTLLYNGANVIEFESTKLEIQTLLDTARKIQQNINFAIQNGLKTQEAEEIKDIVTKNILSDEFLITLGQLLNNPIEDCNSEQYKRWITILKTAAQAIYAYKRKIVSSFIIKATSETTIELPDEIAEYILNLSLALKIFTPYLNREISNCENKKMNFSSLIDKAEQRFNNSRQQASASTKLAASSIW